MINFQPNGLEIFTVEIPNQRYVHAIPDVDQNPRSMRFKILSKNNDLISQLLFRNL